MAQEFPDPAQLRSMQCMGALTISFYLLSNTFQHFLGAFGLHSGRPLILNSAMGFLSTVACCSLSREIQEQIIPSCLKIRPDKQNIEDAISRLYLGVGLYSLLEQRSFLTALPSSVIAVGVYAKRRSLMGIPGSVLASDAVASGKERGAIQILGKRYGCHHCGSKQRFQLDGKGFIADHQPPTKTAKELEGKWLRSFLNFGRFKVVQRLWPQCQRCFQLQGSAVRSNKHVLIYHYGFRPRHLAPAIAMLLAQDEEVQNALRDIVRPSADFYRKYRDIIHKELKQIH
jgi:hypothetical protein